MSNWNSSVLRCDPGDDGCPICLFLSGDKSTGILLQVIELLDKKLAEEERDLRELIKRKQ